MFTIIFPEYDYFNNSQKLRALWYFNFDPNFFAKNTNKLKSILGLVVLLDIDHFKNINDSFGHDKGDLVLKAVSNCIKLVSVGSADAFRWGGEEFLIIFKDTDKEKLLNKVNALQILIKDLNIIDNYRITASFGVIYTDIEDKNSFYSAVSKADKNLYTAKKTGRDKIVAF